MALFHFRKYMNKSSLPHQRVQPFVLIGVVLLEGMQDAAGVAVTENKMHLAINQPVPLE